MIQAPPYALATPVFRFKALASHAGRASLGGDREIALACFAIARLAAGMLPPFLLAPGESATRIANTKQWLSAIALSPAIRAACSGAADAVATNNRRVAMTAISTLIETCAGHLDQGSIAELHELMAELDGKKT
jgi:hypothetical protein